MGQDAWLRAILSAEAFAVLILAGRFFGAIAPERSWPIRVICIGLWGVLLYVLVGQVKAFNLDIPFDWFSAVGLTAYTVLLVGLVWFEVRERRTRRGR